MVWGPLSTTGLKGLPIVSKVKDMPSSEALSRFAEIVGEAYSLFASDDQRPYLEEARGRYVGQAPLVLRPGSVEEVSAILTLATETGTPVIPQGGNTGLVGAGVPLVDDGSGVIVSLGRLNKVLEVDAQSNTMLVEAGCILENLQKAADDADRLFPLSLGAQGTCQIGGNIGSNAGGTGVLAYGNTRELVMGLEVVLPTGEILNTLSPLRKDNTGYDLKNLFVGAEGTLGIVTKAMLKLFPKPRGTAVAFVGLASPQQCLALLTSAKNAAGNGLTGFEFMNLLSVDFTVRHAVNATKHPLGEEYPWCVLMEVSSGQSESDARSTLEAVLENALEESVIENAIIAESLAQQKALWTLREDMSWAQRPEGASIKNDISVPISAIPDFIAEIDPLILSIVPDARIVNFGHMGDGNLHYNISQPIGWDAADFFAFESQIHDAVNDLVLKFGGSISAEHGIGQLKRDKLAKIKDPVALSVMKRLKRELDPAGIMNPGKVLSM